MNRILLVDLGEREHKTREELRGRKLKLESILANKTLDGLNPSQQRDYEAIKKALASDVTADPFYQVLAETVTQIPWRQLSDGNDFVHEYGLLGSQRVPTNLLKPLKEGERELAGIAGILQLDNHVEATRGKADLVRAVSTAQGEYRANRALFDAAFAQLSDQYKVTLQSQIDAGLIDADIIGCERPGGDPNERRDVASTDTPFRPSGAEIVCALSARNVAALVRRLASTGITANDPWLTSRIQNGYDMQAGAIEGAPLSSAEISLPEFDDTTDEVAVRENLLGAQAVVFASHCEDMNMFQVVEKCVDLFRTGLLPISRGKAGDYLYGYLKKASERMTQNERQDLYRQVLGRNEGDPSLPGNPEFKELWLRFIAAVSNFGRQLSVDRLLRTNVPVAVSQEQVRKAGRDLAANLSVHSFGIVRFAAAELQQTILEFRDVLSDPELRACVGARDMWQFIDQVNANYLGGLRNTHQHRTQARSSAVVIRWLANHSDRLAGRYGEVISVNALTNPQMSGSDQPMLNPNDWDLVQACEQWLAVSGVQEASIEQYSQSVESPVIPSRPIGNGNGLPPEARAILEQAGMSLPAL
ncbi:hypothetical protein DWG18_07545 [Lysobacter sp. TY2-98]|uniref:hypothetical protein n=1 Tax=Lysobacter sp. TY2-98 TaxID=2290922 RepID=UPI000E209E61|nr:hypothetical protein [Lysobacter sp. TY2-98]AXK72150.1 hypothetical protein DWG18_07545 [Lysobacter sp. TY2-98]